MIVQSSLDVKLFSLPFLFLTPLEQGTDKSRRDREEGCTCEHLSCQILVFALMFIFSLSLSNLGLGIQRDIRVN